MTPSELKETRKRLGLSLSQVCRQLEVTQPTLCRWESGKRPIPANAIKLFKILNGIPL